MMRGPSRKALVRQRRAAGELEGDVMAALWAGEQGMTPAQVLDVLDAGLAYNTVMTTLRRLHDKGLVGRQREGRAYAYQPVGDASDLAARKLRLMLDTEPDRTGVLQRFVQGLSPEDEQVVRALIDHDD